MAIFCYIFLLAGACIKSLHYVIIRYLLKKDRLGRFPCTLN